MILFYIIILIIIRYRKVFINITSLNVNYNDLKFWKFSFFKIINFIFKINFNYI